MAAELSKIEFYQQTLSVYTDLRGETYFFPGQLCKNMGINAEAQRQAIERSAWSEGWTSVTQVQLPEDKQSRQQFMLHTRRFAMWLATITASRLTDLQVRARVEQYQNEAADVLADWLEKRASPMPNQHVVPQTYIEALRAHLDAEERAETLRVNLAVTEAQKKALVGQNMLLNETIREAEPKVRGYEQLMESDGTISMAQGAKILNIGMGRNGLFRLLREKKIFQKVGQEPYQEYIDRGYFKLRAGSRPTSGGDEYVMTYTPRITAKGLDYLRKIVIGM